MGTIRTKRTYLEKTTRIIELGGNDKAGRPCGVLVEVQEIFSLPAGPEAEIWYNAQEHHLGEGYIVTTTAMRKAHGDTEFKVFGAHQYGTFAKTMDDAKKLVFKKVKATTARYAKLFGWEE
jgi:hypothetical protein